MQSIIYGSIALRPLIAGKHLNERVADRHSVSAARRKRHQWSSAETKEAIRHYGRMALIATPRLVILWTLQSLTIFVEDFAQVGTLHARRS
jgi:hypothetical protein